MRLVDQYINEYGSRVFGLSLKLCKNREDAEDLYQETWIKAYRFWSQYNDTKEFGAWIAGICVNAYKDMLRRSKWRSLLAVFQTNEEKDYAIGSVPARQPEDHSEVRDAVNDLPEKYRLATVLHYFNDLDIEKTAEILGLPAGTVKYHLHKAREILKVRLETNG